MSARSRGDLPLSDYAVIGDGLTAALVARDGGIDWLCHPRFDSPAVFCRLLDAQRGGTFQVSPAGEFTTSRRYVGLTNVLATRFECATGAMRLTDCMPLATDRGSVILRRLEGLGGEVPVRVDFVPTFDFARARAAIHLRPDGCDACGAGTALRLTCPGRVTGRAGGAISTFTLAAGQVVWVTVSEVGAEPAPDEADKMLRSTVETWERWSARGRYPAPYEDVLRRSALVLKLLTHDPTGAVVASPTTSLPEDPGGVRNWDYRFSWLRDASWVVSALMELGYHDESMAFIDWLQRLDLARTAPSIFYDLDGRPTADELELEHLRGYRGSRPVRVGNAAAGQDQHDIFGEVVAAIQMCSDGMASMRPLAPELWSVAGAMADRAARHWEHADHGLWEQRGEPQHFLSSKLLCWAALDGALAIAARDGLSGPLERWRAERDRVRAAILGEGFHAGVGCFTRVPGEPDLDATALLLPRYHFLPGDDPRMVATVARLREGLSAGGGLLRRYAVADGLPGSEGAFVACSFWLVDCLAQQGKVDEAHRIFESVVARSSDVGLLSEELSPSGELLGNYPQAFSHLALIRAAVSLARARAGPASSRASPREGR